MSQASENKMGVMPVKRLVLSMSLPMMISMLVQALYNVVDSYFVAKISEDALTAVGMAFPFQNLMIAVSVGTGVGVNALLSRSLGAKDQETANRSAENGVLLAAISSVVFMAIALLFAQPFFELQKATPEIARQGAAYLRICGGLSFGIFLEVMFERLLQSTGRTFHTMITQGVGAVINIVMDPVLIFGLGPFPKMGVAGAAAATVLGPDRSRHSGAGLQHHLQPRYSAHPEGLPAQWPDHPPDLQRGRAHHRPQLYQLHHDLRHEPDSHFLHLHGGGGI